MKIVSILNQKGGVGKTTLSTNIAHCLKEEKEKKVLLVDSDPQGSARDWNAAGEAKILPVIGIDRPTLDKDIKAVEGNYDFIVIDGAPQLAAMAIAAIKCSDIILIPVQPSPYDIWATDELVQLIKQRQSINNGHPKTAFVISRKIHNTKLGKEIRSALLAYELPVFKSGTTQRILYAESAAEGLTVIVSHTDRSEKLEIRSITDELLEFLQ